MFSYIDFLKFFANPVLANAADLPLNTPNSNESPAITTITPPTINTCFILPVEIPLSIKVDINSGINNSIITSNVTNIGVIIDAFLYSLTWLAKVLSIMTPPYKYIFNFVRVLTIYLLLKPPF